MTNKQTYKTTTLLSEKNKIHLKRPWTVMNKINEFITPANKNAWEEVKEIRNTSAQGEKINFQVFQLLIYYLQMLYVKNDPNKP